jgi:ubiquinone/menaquinone biosynthesis C-methylase UbiE
MFPRATVLGVDVLDESLALARTRNARFGSRLTFENQSVYELRAPDGTFDLTVNRHVIHSIPHADRVLAELKRVTRPGGRLHLIPEDYGMLHFQRGALDPRDFWHEGPTKFGEATGTDLLIGRDSYEILVDLGMKDIAVDYVVVDTVRVPRETFAAIIEAWRDGYVDPIAEYTRFTREEATAYFDQMIADIRNPRRYAVWMVPVVSARVPNS